MASQKGSPTNLSTRRMTLVRVKHETYEAILSEQLDLQRSNMKRQFSLTDGLEKIIREHRELKERFNTLQP